MKIIKGKGKGTALVALALTLVVLTGCGDVANVAKPLIAEGYDNGNTASKGWVVGHKVTDIEDEYGYCNLVVFKTQVYEELLAWVPKKMLAERRVTSGILWPVAGSNIDDAAVAMNDLGHDCITVVTPIIGGDGLSLPQIELQISFLEYLQATFFAPANFKIFTLYGQGWGGTIALAIAHLRPDLVKKVATVSPHLVLSSGYSPINWIEDVFPDIPILVVVDSRDSRGGEFVRYREKAHYVGINLKVVARKMANLSTLGLEYIAFSLPH